MEKELATTKKITQGLIGNWLLWEIVFGIIYFVIYSLIAHSMESMIIQAVIAIVMQGIIVFLIWKISTKSVFKNKIISSDDVPTVMKNLIIFTIVICVINGIYQFSQVNSTIDNAINSNFQLKYTESMMSHLYNNEQMAEYNNQKEDAIAKVKSQAYTYLAIIEIGLTTVHLAVLPFEKKEILKYVG